MKIKQIYKILKNNVGKLTIDSENRPNNLGIIKNAGIVSKALREIGDLNISVQLEKLKQTYADFYGLIGNECTMKKEEVTSVSRNIDIIHNEVQSIINTLEEFIPQETGFLLSVKLPEYKTLESLPEFYNSLDRTFSSLVKTLGTDDELEIYSFENGSKWNDFLVKNKTTLTILMLFIETATSVYGEYISIQNLKGNIQSPSQQAKSDVKDSSHISQDWDEMFIQMEDGLYDKSADDFIQILKDKDIEIGHNGKEPNEVNVEVRKAYKSYIKLAKDGTEFYVNIEGEHEEVEEIEISIEEFNDKQTKISHVKKTSLIKTETTKYLEDTSTLAAPEDSETEDGEE